MDYYPIGDNTRFDTSAISPDIDKIFVNECSRAILLYEIYSDMKNYLVNHPSYSESGIDSGSDLYTDNKNPIFIENTFSSFTLDSIQKYLFNRTVLHNTEIELNATNSVFDVLKKRNYKNKIIEAKNKLASLLISDTNDFFTRLFVPMYNINIDRSVDCVFTDNDQKTFDFFFDLIKYVLDLGRDMPTSSSEFIIHHETIHHLLQKHFGYHRNDQAVLFDSIMLIIVDFIDNETYNMFRQFNKKYTGFLIIAYIIKKNFITVHEFINDNNLFDLTDSIIFY